MVVTSWLRLIALVVAGAVALVISLEPVWATPEAKDALFLVAKPDLVDPLFGHSVVLMLPPAPPLVVGLIVNKPTRLQLSEILADQPGFKNRVGKAYFGGPVEVTSPSVVFRSATALSNTTFLSQDIYVALEAETVATLLKSSHPPQDLRVYLGRSQWSTDQLHAEMQEGSWYTVPTDPNIVFSTDPDQLWRAMVERAQLRMAAKDEPWTVQSESVVLFPTTPAFEGDCSQGWRAAYPKSTTAGCLGSAEGY